VSYVTVSYSLLTETRTGVNLRINKVGVNFIIPPSTKFILCSRFIKQEIKKDWPKSDWILQQGWWL
jgi:hypothetical protein